jgi:hypothetical protein
MPARRVPRIAFSPVINPTLTGSEIGADKVPRPADGRSGAKISNNHEMYPYLLQQLFWLKQVQKE